MLRSTLAILSLLACSAALIPSMAQQQPSVAPAAGVLGKGASTEYGPLVFCAVETPGPDGKAVPLTLNGLLLRSGDTWLCFDTVKLTLVGVWPKAVLDLKKSTSAPTRDWRAGRWWSWALLFPHSPGHWVPCPRMEKQGTLAGRASAVAPRF